MTVRELGCQRRRQILGCSAFPGDFLFEERGVERVCIGISPRVEELDAGLSECKGPWLTVCLSGVEFFRVVVWRCGKSLQTHEGACSGVMGQRFRTAPLRVSMTFLPNGEFQGQMLLDEREYRYSV
ncbi:unnamed protein product [Ostreobium quekettii]|uniref:Uncharacterized protein n=1 Tax=Ostreobium quekettii TaxID=121088 RepID=A0A8S1JD53_9CHLO|nr:unnamed protein product [Ostreobium quekettii]